MLTEFLSLLCLGLSLGFGDEKKNETLPKPSLSALSSSVVGHRGNVTLRCQSHFQNVTFTLGKLQDSGYRQEQRSTGHKAEFLLTHLEPKDAGMYFCAYKTMDSQEWSGESDYLQLEVKDDLDGRGATEVKNDAPSTARHMKNPPGEPAILNFPSRRLQIYPTWIGYLSRLKDPQGVSHADLYLRQLLSPAEEPPGSVNVR